MRLMCGKLAVSVLGKHCRCSLSANYSGCCCMERTAVTIVYEELEPKGGCQPEELVFSMEKKGRDAGMPGSVSVYWRNSVEVCRPVR